MQHAQVRIVAGSLRGRKLQFFAHPGLRPTPQMVREALFSILGNAVPERPFLDVFAGTGVNGLEALSRGASLATFVERDPRLADRIEAHLHSFGVASRAQVIRSDVYRWADRSRAPTEPVNFFVSPPFADLKDRPDAFQRLVDVAQTNLAKGSVLILQVEEGFALDQLPNADRWENRKYGRNVLLFWEPSESEPSETAQE